MSLRVNNKIWISWTIYGMDGSIEVASVPMQTRWLDEGEAGSCMAAVMSLIQNHDEMDQFGFTDTYVVVKPESTEKLYLPEVANE